MIAASVLVLILTAAPATPDEGDAARAKAAFQAAQKLYKQSHFPEAITKFEEAYRLKPHPSIFFNLGLCYEQVAELPKALRNYREYLRALPEAKDKQVVAASIVDLERRLKAQGVQQLLVYSEPAGATVAIDGKSIGPSPSSIELKPGNHSLNLSRDGFETVDRIFVMPADTSMELSFVLKAGTSPRPAEATADSTGKPTEPVTRAAPGEPPPTPPPSVVAAAPESGHSLRGKAWIPAALGGALLVTGGIFYGMGKGAEGRFTSGDAALMDPTVRAGVKSSGGLNETLGVVFGGVGIAAVAAAATMFFLPTHSGPVVSVIATPTMGAAVVSGEFP